MKFSVVCPIHNEEKMLHYSLRSIFALKPNEAIFMLDRCTDASESIILDYAKRIDYQRRGQLIIKYYRESDCGGWNFRSACMRRDAYAMTENDVILNTSADLYLDPTIKKYLPEVGHPYGLVSFAYLDYPFTYVTFIRRLLNIIRPGKGFSGLLAVSKKAWLNCEDLEDLKKIPRGEDTHLSRSMMGKYKQVNRITNSRHLRPHGGFADSYLTGVAYHDQLHYSDLKMLSYCFMFLDPVPMVGLRHARAMRGVNNWRQGDILYCQRGKGK